MKKYFKYLSLSLIIFLWTSAYSQQSYKFDSSANVYGCSNVLLQKISKNLRYELLVSIEFDSIPKKQELDITKYSKFIKIYLNKYPKGNTYVHDICNDVIRGNANKPTEQFEAFSGTLTITYISGKDFIISAITKDLMLKTKSDVKIKIPFEFFNYLQVGWIGG